jgi:hypothetical protein
VGLFPIPPEIDAMGLFDRLKALRSSRNGNRGDRSSASQRNVAAHLHGGDEDLEVVGEASYQDVLWALCGGQLGDRIRNDITAVLVPEPQNPYDVNAIAIRIDGRVVGYLGRAQAAAYLPGLQKRMRECGGLVALRGEIVGGGYYPDGPGRLGVWLKHDPSDFGIASASPARVRLSAVVANSVGTLRTGFTEAWLTDLEDDSYDLSWLEDLPDADGPAIVILRDLLLTDPDPIDRHFQFAELERRLYRSRDLLPGALDEYDRTCQAHDNEMETICEAFRRKWAKIPLLETYRQMAIRQQKHGNWRSCLWWVERGLYLYGNDAAREDAVEDLVKRRNRALSKLETPSTPESQRPDLTGAVFVSNITSTTLSPGLGESMFEVLICTRCQESFQRAVVRGRKPLLCTDCRTRSD